MPDDCIICGGDVIQREHHRFWVEPVGEITADKTALVCERCGEFLDQKESDDVEDILLDKLDGRPFWKELLFDSTIRIPFQSGATEPVNAAAILCSLPNEKQKEVRWGCLLHDWDCRLSAEGLEMAKKLLSLLLRSTIRTIPEPLRDSADAAMQL